MSPSEAISPTAHYTGYVWARNGLSHPALDDDRGPAACSRPLRPLIAAEPSLGGASLETYLLARHRRDRHAARAGDRGARGHAGDRGRVRALAARLAVHSALRRAAHLCRGRPAARWRRASGPRYGGSDRSASTTESRRSMRSRTAVPPASPARHSLASSTPARGLAIVTEGLLGYLPTDAVDGLWRRFARMLDGLRTRPLRLRPPHGGPPDRPGPGVPRDAVGIRARAGASALRRTRRRRRRRWSLRASRPRRSTRR